MKQNDPKFIDLSWCMNLAIEQAQKARFENEVPVGAVIIDQLGNIISKAHNQKEQNFDACAHAEIIAISKAGNSLRNWRLLETTMIVTLEPCLMCINALVQARISHLVFGAYDYKGGALSLGYNFHNNSKLNHRFSVIGGFEHYQNSQIISNFFKEKRKYYKKS